MSIPPADFNWLLDFVESVATHDASAEAQAAFMTVRKLTQMGWVHYNLTRQLRRENRDLKRKLERLRIERERKLLH
jgi:hypothetical protein